MCVPAGPFVLSFDALTMGFYARVPTECKEPEHGARLICAVGFALYTVAVVYSCHVFGVWRVGG